MEVLLLGFMAVTAIAVVRLRQLFAVVMLTGIFSLLSAGVFVAMDAVDVAFTEAAVGAGISTLLMLGCLALTTSEEKPVRHRRVPALLAIGLTGACLVYGTLDLPGYGSPAAPAYRHVAPRYIHDSPREVGLPNIVTSVLASYRGYDTLGEVTVVFTAGVAVLLLLGRGARRSKGDDES